MHNYTFAGKVLPERAFVTLGPIPRIKIRTILTDDVMDLDAHVVINSAQVMVVVRSAKPIDNLETLRNTVESVVRGIVDAFGYIEGRGYDVEMTSVIDSTGGQWQIFPIEIAAIQATKDDRPVTFGELHALLNSTAPTVDEDVSFRLMQLRLALGDLREAVRSIDHSAFFCYRAIECLRQCYVEPRGQASDASRKASWVRMREELCIARSWIDQIEEAGTVERHGGHKAMSGEQRIALMMKTWKVVDRFIMSGKVGFRPLSEELLE